jgi:iron complex outermembrane receptor protein
LNFIEDQFHEKIFINWPARNEFQRTVGVFVQQTWKQSEFFRLETGLRADHVEKQEWYLLPRVAALFRINDHLSSRIGGGLGYKTPSIFNEEAERLQYRNIRPVNLSVDKAERSYGLNADINWKKPFASGQGQFSMNHLFFYTRISHPFLLLQQGSEYVFTNSRGHFDSRGMETNLRVKYKPFVLFVGYTYTDAQLHEDSREKENYLTPRHRLNNVLMFEQEEKWKLGLEAYYFSSQWLSDGTRGRSYWITGFMAEKLWEKWSLYINFENFLDTRQTRFEKIYAGDISSPVFRDIYAPLDGRVINGGIKLRI